MRYLGCLSLCILCSLAGGQARAEEDRAGGKLLLTGGVSSVEGAAGGGLASWAVIGGNETEDGIGGSAHATYIALPDFDLASAGVAVGWRDRIELSYARARFDTRSAGAALGLGNGFAFSEDVFGAKLRLVGDAVWDQGSLLPQIAVGIQHGHANQGAVIHAIGGRHASGTDFYIAATKVILSQSLVLNGTVRFTKANQFGLLGFGGDAGDGQSGGVNYGGGNAGDHRTAQFEGSAGMLIAPNLLAGAEYRSKPDNLRFAHENDSYDLFAALAAGHHITLTAAYVDLGSIATFAHQRGIFASLQGSF